MKLISLLIFLVLSSAVDHKAEVGVGGQEIDYFSRVIFDGVIADYEYELDSALAASTDNFEPDFFTESYSFDVQVISYRFETDNQISLRRVTKKPRNEHNRATSYEVDVLNEFEVSNNYLDTKIIRSRLGQKFQVHYFKAIRVESECLLCHGTSQDVPLPVKTSLGHLYRNDQAFDYSVGDLIGMYVLSIAVPANEDSLQQVITRTTK